MTTRKRILQLFALVALLVTVWFGSQVVPARSAAAGTLTARQLTQMYLDRIDAYDKQGPMINSVITINSKRLAYSFEQVTHHRIPPKTTPPLIGARSN